jgi:hypothetical protein
MGSQIFVAYPRDDPAGEPLGVLTDAVDKEYQAEDDGIGSGRFTISRHSPQAAWCGAGTYVRVWRDAVAGSAVGGFWIEEGADTVLSVDGSGGEDLVRAGRGTIAVLREARVWHRAATRHGTDAHLQRSKGRWLWRDAHPARPLLRMLEEAKARGCLPFVTWDFDRDDDSDGVPWDGDAAERITLEIGTSLLDVVTILRETGLHIVMDGDFGLHARDAYERDLTASITFSAGVDIRESSERELRARRSVGVALVSGERQVGEGDDTRDALRFRTVRDEATWEAQGRRTEGFVAYPHTASRSLLGRVGARKLKKWRRLREGPLTLGVLELPGRVALVDYVPGDTVARSIPDAYEDTARIAAVTLTDTEAGACDAIVSFGDWSRDSRAGRGGGGGAGRGEGGRGGVDTRTYVFDDFARPTLGSIPTGDDTGAWWDGGIPWVPSQPEAWQSSAEVTGGAFVVTATGPEGGTPVQIDVVDEESSGQLPFVRQTWTLLVTFTLGGAPIVPTDEGQRFFVIAVYGYYYSHLEIDLGDGVADPGIVFEGLRADRAIPAGTCRVRVTHLGGAGMARMWDAADPEPETWDLVVPELVPTLEAWAGTYEDEARLTLIVSLGGESGTQTLAISDLCVAALGGPGETWGRHVLAFGDGTTTTFTTELPYVRGSLRVWLDNVPVTVEETDRTTGAFTFARAPYGDPADPSGSAVIEVACEVA